MELVRRAVWGDEDWLGLSVSQPLRLHAGTARVTLPVAYDYATETTTRASHRGSMVPRGREINLELAYSFGVPAGAIQANLLHRREPGHVASAAPETVMLVQFKTVF